MILQKKKKQKKQGEVLGDEKKTQQNINGYEKVGTWDFFLLSFVYGLKKVLQ